jgi:hypothetical protein
MQSHFAQDDEPLQRMERVQCSGGVNFDDDEVAVPLSTLAEPITEGGGETRRIDAQAGFEAAVGSGESVVELGGAGEVAHAEGIDPFERAGFSFSGDEDFHAQFSRVHGKSIAFP